jgi:DNA modification methylase
MKKPRPQPTTLAALTADPQNRRTHNDANLALIAASLKDVGAARSIVIDEDNVILAGNGVTQAAQQAGLKKLRVIEATGNEIIAVRRRGLTDAQKRALALYDNRTAELATWNVEQLLADQTAGLDLGAWWTDAELAALLNANGGPKTGLTDPDAVPEVRATDIQRGDLFELGAHRLLCGDSTQAADVARVMGEERGHCLFTDPPYGVAYDGGLKKRTSLANDHVGTSIYTEALPLLAQAVDDESALYLWYADGHAAAAAAAAAAAGYQIVAQIVWAKNHAQFVTSAHYKGKHEACYYGHKRGQTARWHGPNNEVTLWECDRAPANDFHPTQKPVALAERAIANSTASGQRVLDGFIGGGSTLIACEELARRCRAIDIEPQYVQVTLDRWAAFTGQRAVKVGEAVRAQGTHGAETRSPAPRAPKAAAQTSARRRGYDGRPRTTGA